MEIESDQDQVDSEVSPAVKEEDEETVLSELHQPIWSIVSFKECIKNNLTYDEAVEKMAELAEQKISGLCIITDEAASKVSK